MTHTCRWVGCTKKVPLNLWGCRAHWYRLPKTLRDAIWRGYRPGQEEDLDISPEWEEADRRAREYSLIFGDNYEHKS